MSLSKQGYQNNSLNGITKILEFLQGVADLQSISAEFVLNYTLNNIKLWALDYMQVNWFAILKYNAICPITVSSAKLKA